MSSDMPPSQSLCSLVYHACEVNTITFLLGCTNQTLWPDFDHEYSTVAFLHGVCLYTQLAYVHSVVVSLVTCAISLIVDRLQARGDLVGS